MQSNEKVGVDDNYFYKGWVDWWCLYLNDTWEGVKKSEKETGFDPEYYEMRKEILDWLEKHYTLNSFAQIGRR